MAKKKTKITRTEKPWWDATYYEKYLELIIVAFSFGIITWMFVFIMQKFPDLSELYRYLFFASYGVYAIFHAQLMMGRKGLSMELSASKEGVTIKSDFQDDAVELDNTKIDTPSIEMPNNVENTEDTINSKIGFIK